MIGQIVGQYRIMEKLGEGGMGAVYKGIDTMVEREVAIKMLRPEIARQPELVERFRSEAVTLAKLNNPGIATLYNFFRQGDDYFMVMEYVRGRTLDDIIRRGGAMAWDRAASMFCQVLEAVQPAHNAGIQHRDIKPANIMLTDSGAIKVMDFGIARVLGTARMTREGRMVGTIEYISPERVTGQEADARADIYSLGVVLYEMLSGHLPFESETEFEIMRGHVQMPPPPLAHFHANVPPAVEAVVMKALSKTPDARFQSCAQFAQALQSAFSEAIASGQRQGPKPTMFAEVPSVVPPPLRPPTPAFPVQPPVLPQSAMPYMQQPPRPFVPPPPQPSLAAGLNWMHYTAAGVVVFVLLIGGLLALYLGRSGKDLKTVPEQADKKTVTPPPERQVVVAPPNPAQPASDSLLDRIPTKAEIPAKVETLPTVADANAAAKERETARIREQLRRKAAALKALDEQ